MTIGWIAFVARVEDASGKHGSLSEIAIAVVNKSAPAIPLIILCAMFTVAALDTAGGFIVVTYRYLERKFLKPQQERLQKEALEQGLEQGREQGESRVQCMWEDWNRRREEAEMKGEPFDEPPPRL